MGDGEGFFFVIIKNNMEIIQYYISQALLWNLSEQKIA